MITIRTSAPLRDPTERKTGGAVRRAILRAAAIASLLAAVAGAEGPAPPAKETVIPVPERGTLYVRYGTPGGVMIRSVRRPAIPRREPAAGTARLDVLSRVIAEELERARPAAPGPVRTPITPPAIVPGTPPGAPVVVTRPRGKIVGGVIPGAFPLPGGPDLTDLTPEQAAAELSESGVLRTTRILFALNRADLLPESETAIATVAQVLQDNPGWRIRVEGHADKRGGECYNLTLSRRRAEAVQDDLVKKFGIAADRLAAIGFGEMLPLSDEETEVAYAANRRVEFRLME